MIVAIRTDTSHQIGTDHFMLCLTLAKALRQRGIEIPFICRFLTTDCLVSTFTHTLKSINGDIHTNLCEVTKV